MNVLILFVVCFCIYHCEVQCADDYTADFVVVGAGAAGSVVASRLSEDGKYSVLLLEAGGEPEKYYDIPYFAPGPLTGSMVWNVTPETEKKACGAFINDTCYLFMGRGLGGSTMINAMIHSRGNKRDYNNWRDLGNDGWGYDDVLPFFIKSENFKGPVTETTKKYHGFDGPFIITAPPYYPAMTDMVLEAGREIGYKVVDQDAESQTGFSQGYFNLRDGHRLSAYRAYLEDQRSNRPNLQILTFAYVLKIIFDDSKTAIGVEFEHDGAKKTARAMKEVIICAGAINSPKLLQLSGIGPKALLDKFGIPVVHELVGVGSNLQEHVMLSGLAITFKENFGFRYDRDATPDNFAKLAAGEGPLTVPMRNVAVAYAHTKYNNKSEDWPDLQLLMFQVPVRPPYKKEYEVTDEQVSCQNNLVFTPMLLRPKSIGSVLIRSNDPHDQPTVNFNLLSEQDDVNRLVDSKRKKVELDNTAFDIFFRMLSTNAFIKHGAYLSALPALKTCGIQFANYLGYGYYECLVRLYSNTYFHVCGTCKMGPQNDPKAVVDSELRVHGIKNLRVIDNSISPKIISGNTMALVIMIAEKGSDMIRKYWDGQ